MMTVDLEAAELGSILHVLIHVHKTIGESCRDLELVVINNAHYRVSGCLSDVSNGSQQTEGETKEDGSIWLMI